MDQQEIQKVEQEIENTRREIEQFQKERQAKRQQFSQDNEDYSPPKKKQESNPFVVPNTSDLDHKLRQLNSIPLNENKLNSILQKVEASFNEQS